MDIEFSLPLKFYHAYLEEIYAPQGLGTSSRHLEKHKWRRFGPETQLQFTIRRERNYITIKVARNGQALDYAFVNSNGGREMIQFCARNPSISCKYMVTSTHMRRFQVTFSNDLDFLEANNRIVGLGFTVVRAQAPLINSQSATIPQGISQTPLQSILSLPAQKTTSNEDTFLQSQLAPDMPMNPWKKLGPVKGPDLVVPNTLNINTTTRVPETDSDLVQLQEPSPPERRFSEEDCPRFPNFNDSIVAPSATNGNYLAVNAGSEILTSQPPGKSSIENKEVKSPPSPLLDNRITLPREVNKPVWSPLPQVPIATQSMIQLQTPQTPESISQISAPQPQIPISTSGPTSTHPLASAVMPPENQNQNQNKDKEQNQSQDKEQNQNQNNEQNNEVKKLEINTSNSDIYDVKISKKLIKRKLKDKDFLKWVSKVERVLNDMVEKRS